MRTIYLIRHGAPAFPNGERVCIGSTDLPLSRMGRMQAVLLQAYFEEIPLSGIYHSELSRARETAQIISESAMAIQGMNELEMGAWEGKSFCEIRTAFPDLYKERGAHPAQCQIPGGELPTLCCVRAQAALRAVVDQTAGDIAIVAHAGTNRLLLCSLMNIPLDGFLEIPQPYGCVNILEEENGRFNVAGIAVQPHPVLDLSLCKSLLDAAGTPLAVQSHCLAVAKKATEIAKHLRAKGCQIDQDLLHAAAALHDIARTEPDHATTGAKWLGQLGYPEVARIISCHHDLGEKLDQVISEESILYLADKLIEETREVSLQERFARSARKCRTENAKAVHHRRYDQAINVERMIAGYAAGRFSGRI